MEERRSQTAKQSQGELVKLLARIEARRIAEQSTTARKKPPKAIKGEAMQK